MTSPWHSGHGPSTVGSNGVAEPPPAIVSTDSRTNWATSVMNAARESRPAAIALNRRSHSPVISAEANVGTGSLSMTSIPRSVGTSCFLLRRTYSRRISVSIVAARVAGVPSPQSFIAARRASSSIVLPADSMDASKLASSNRLGGRVCPLGVSRVAGRRSPRWTVGISGASVFDIGGSTACHPASTVTRAVA